jgi:tetratricopeptide (TPR) repeat protein
MKYLILLCFPCFSFSQQNCNIFLWQGDTAQYKACKIGEETSGRYYQFHRKYQEAYDEALAICPYYAAGYASKSTAYLKSGDFVTWKVLMDKAVAYDAVNQLGYRGWCRYQFFRDYRGAIADIERLDSMKTGDIGYGVNGDYHLHIARGICYSAIGEKRKAIEVFEVQLAQADHFLGNFDHYQLGVTYLQIGDTEAAAAQFEKQRIHYDFAENAYWRAQMAKRKNDSAQFQILRTLAIQLHSEGKKLNDPYTYHFNHVYYSDLTAE